MKITRDYRSQYSARRFDQGNAEETRCADHVAFVRDAASFFHSFSRARKGEVRRQQLQRVLELHTAFSKTPCYFHRRITTCLYSVMIALRWIAFQQFNDGFASLNSSQKNSKNVSMPEV